MRKKGFTLIELMIVVIIIAILATLALPQYVRAVERTRVGKGKHHLGLIAQAEKLYRADRSVYLAADNASLNTGGLQEFVEMNEIVVDTDWDYAVAVAVGTFTATATRTAGATGAYNGQTIILDQNGTWTGTHLLR